MLRAFLDRLTGRRAAGPPASIFDLVGPPPQALRREPAAPAQAKPRLLEIQNRFGSVEHFYHFVLGYMTPLIVGPVPDNPGTRYVIRSCGPMDDHLRALGLPNVDILPKQVFAEHLRNDPGNVDRLAGFDEPDFYDAAVFVRLRKAMLDRLKPEINPLDGVLLVDRGASPAFYQSAASEAKTSANMRRSVPNMANIARAVEAAGMATRTVTLETATLRDQLGLFAGSRTLVAQHGAALVNMLWMPAGSTIVEINPTPRDPKFGNCFAALARSCGHRYRVVDQSNSHARVEPTRVVAALHALSDQP